MTLCDAGVTVAFDCSLMKEKKRFKYIVHASVRLSSQVSARVDTDNTRQYPPVFRSVPQDLFFAQLQKKNNNFLKNLSSLILLDA